MIAILSLIDRGENATPKGLAEHFNVHVRSIFRDLDALSSDFPIFFDDTANSYRFSEGYSFRKINLSINEVRAILVSKAAVAKLGDGVAKAYDGLMKKINSETGCKTNERMQSQSSNYWFDIDPVEDYSAVRKPFEAIQKALDDKNSLEITYQSMSTRKITTRMIDPYGLFCSKGVWYTLAHCRLKDDIREFALDCIQAVKPTDKHYAIPKVFSMDDYFKTGWHIITYGKPVEIILLFSNNVARWIQRKRWHPSQKIEQKKDGSIVFKVTVNGTLEIKRWLYQWGPDCEVIAPSSFRKEVAFDINKMSQKYR